MLALSASRCHLPLVTAVALTTDGAALPFTPGSRQGAMRRAGRVQPLCRLFVGAVVAIGFAARPAVAQQPQTELRQIQVSAPGCNSVSFWQVPDYPDLFIGRMLNVSDPARPCKRGHGWSLVLERMDWAEHRLSVVSTILPTPVRIANGLEVWSAY